MGSSETPDNLKVLMERRQACRVCCDLDPDRIKNGSEFDFDPPVVSYWSQWLGNPEPTILIVGQDFGSIEYFTRFRGKDEPNNQTNTNLRQLLREAGVHVATPPLFDPDAQVFLTNAILCLKAGNMDASIKEGWVRNCAALHLTPLIEILEPAIIVGMGNSGWLAVRTALQMRDVPSQIGQAAGRMWTLPSQMKVFAIGHCGPKGRINRPWAMQVLDWQKIGTALKGLSGDPSTVAN